MELKLKVDLVNQFVVEIFGTKDVQDPLLVKNLSQKTKFHLKKLGNALLEERKIIYENAQELVAKYFTEEQEVTKEDGSIKTEKVVPQEMVEEWNAKNQELSDLEISVNCYDFTEVDFIDDSTGKVVASSTYYNLIDKLLYEDK